MQTEIFTQRLVLNIITEEDDDFIRSLVNTEGWLQFIGDRNVHSKQDAIDYIRKIKNTPNLFYWVVRLKDTPTPLGIISFLKRHYLEHFDIGFAFFPEYNGCGYAYEAAEKVLSIASQQAEYSTILATTIPQNIASIKLLNKLGLHFQREIEMANETLHVYSN